jgi:hypothetical protein
MKSFYADGDSDGTSTCRCVNRLGRRRSRTDGGFVERSADHVKAEDPNGLRREPVVGQCGMKVAEHALDERDARRHVRSVQGNQRKEIACPGSSGRRSSPRNPGRCPGIGVCAYF